MTERVQETVARLRAKSNHPESDYAEAADMLEALAARLAEVEALLKMAEAHTLLNSTIAAVNLSRAEAAEAEIARLRTAAGAAGVLLADMTDALDPMTKSREGASKDWVKAADAADDAPTYMTRPTALQMIRAALRALATGEPK